MNISRERENKWRIFFYSKPNSCWFSKCFLTHNIPMGLCSTMCRYSPQNSMSGSKLQRDKAPQQARYFRFVWGNGDKHRGAVRKGDRNTWIRAECKPWRKFFPQFSQKKVVMLCWELQWYPLQVPASLATSLNSAFSSSTSLLHVTAALPHMWHIIPVPSEKCADRRMRRMRQKKIIVESGKPFYD